MKKLMAVATALAIAACQPKQVAQQTPPMTPDSGVQQGGCSSLTVCWSELLELAGKRDKSGLTAFRTSDATLGSLRQVLLQDFDEGSYSKAEVPPEPVYQPRIDVGIIRERVDRRLTPGILTATLDASGSVVSVRWKRKTEFAEANTRAETTVRTWRFRPAMEAGRFVASELDIVIRLET